MKNIKLPDVSEVPFTKGLSAAPVGARAQHPEWATQRVEQRLVESLVDDDVEVIRELASRGVTEDSVRAHARSLGMTWEFIKQCRLSGSRPAMRMCMKCDARFLSSGIDNRLCRRCFRR